MSTTAVREPRPGEILGGRYKIEHELGRGGFGVVFQARHLEMDKIVALKVLLATYAMADSTAVDRFRREARIASHLNYPNTVRVFDYGETEHGIFYLVMEFIRGTPLSKVIRTAGPIPAPRAVHVTSQVLHALTEAHERGIIHRDIKPENVMIVPLAHDPDFVKVMDFGIAKMAGERASEQITRAGLALGTPRYMPVEQLTGHELTPATDLYATGLVLYEMLSGRPAFQADTMVDLAVRIIEGKALEADPSTGVPAGLCGIVNQACAKRPEDRFADTHAFLDALARWTAEQAAASASTGLAALVGKNQAETLMLTDPSVAQELQKISLGSDSPTAAVPVQPAAPTATRQTPILDPAFARQLLGLNAAILILVLITLLVVLIRG